MQRNNSILLLALIVLFTGISCDRAHYKKYKEIPDKVWDNSFQPEFNVEIEDTSKFYNINIHVRNASHYPFSNLWIFIHTTSPTGKKQTDTLECVLADKSGEWLGDGMGDIWDNEILWIKNYKFPQKGSYKYKFEQAMRSGKIPGIMDVGLSVKYSKQNK